MIQAVDSAIASDSVVIYIPQGKSRVGASTPARARDFVISISSHHPAAAINLINSSSPFVYNEASQTFHQPALSAKLLASILTANKDVLSTIKIGKDVTVQTTSTSGASTSFAETDGLDKLVVAGARNEALSVSALEQVFEILATQTESVDVGTASPML